MDLSRRQFFKVAGKIGTPVPKIDRDSVFGVDIETFEGEAEFRLPVKVDAKARPGKQNLSITFRYQVCSGTTCLPPRNTIVTGPVTIATGIAER